MIEDLLRPVGDPQGLGGITDHTGFQVGDSKRDVGGAEVGGQHDPAVRVESDSAGRPATRRPGLAGRHDQTGGEQFVDPRGRWSISPGR